MPKRQRRILWGTLFLASLLVSVLLFLFRPQPLKPLVVYFPTAGFLQISSELHFIPKSDDRKTQIRYAVDSVLSGPLSMKFKRTVPQNTSLRAIYLNKDVLYLDFDQSIQAPESESPLSVPSRLDLIRRTIAFNFHDISNVIILIQGQQIGVPEYRGDRKS